MRMLREVLDEEEEEEEEEEQDTEGEKVQPNQLLIKG